jgi:hypothetical protein
MYVFNAPGFSFLFILIYSLLRPSSPPFLPSFIFPCSINQSIQAKNEFESLSQQYAALKREASMLQAQAHAELQTLQQSNAAAENRSEAMAARLRSAESESQRLATQVLFIYLFIHIYISVYVYI